MARTWDVTVLTVVSIWKLVTGTIPASNIGGPLQISMVAGQQAQQGLLSYAFFVALISVNLAILNLLPVPMLDGGHLLFFAIEAVLGRPLSSGSARSPSRSGSPCSCSSWCSRCSTT